jgi:4-hydroxyphenylacetate 3-monooxygenase
MLMTGEDYLDSIRDGGCVYVGGERVDDVTTHPAFRNAARSFAMIYDRKRPRRTATRWRARRTGKPFRPISCCRARARIWRAGSRRTGVSRPGRTA